MHSLFAVQLFMFAACCLNICDCSLFAAFSRCFHYDFARVCFEGKINVNRLDEGPL